MAPDDRAGGNERGSSGTDRRPRASIGMNQSVTARALIIVPVLVLFIALIVLLLIARFVKSLFVQLFTVKTTGHEQ